MHFEDERNIMSIINNGFKKYKATLLNKQILYVYYNHLTNAYEYVEVVFKKEHFKHLCGISDKLSDVKVYKNLGINKEIINANQFWDLLQKHKLQYKHLILKQDGSSKQKLNILNNIDKIINTDTLYYNTEKKVNKLECDFMIGVVPGNITVAMLRKTKFSIPISSLDYDIKSNANPSAVFPIVLIGIKAAYSTNLYEQISYQKVNIKELPIEIQKILTNVEKVS